METQLRPAWGPSPSASALRFHFHPQFPRGKSGAGSPTCSRRRGTTSSAWTKPPGICGVWGTRTTRRGGWVAPDPGTGRVRGRRRGERGCLPRPGSTVARAAAAGLWAAPASPTPRVRASLSCEQDPDLGGARQSGAEAGSVGCLPGRQPLLPPVRQRQGEEAHVAEERYGAWPRVCSSGLRPPRNRSRGAVGPSAQGGRGRAPVPEPSSAGPIGPSVQRPLSPCLLALRSPEVVRGSAQAPAVSREMGPCVGAWGRRAEHRAEGGPLRSGEQPATRVGTRSGMARGSSGGAAV